MVKKVMDWVKNSGINLREVAVSALTLAVIAGAMTAALALTNAVTKDRIEKINRQTQSGLRKQVIDADTFEEKRFTENGEEVSYYAAKKGNQPVGFVFTVSSTGKSSGLVVMTGISTEGKVTGVVVVEDNETAGFVDMVRKGGLLDRIAGWSSDLKLKLGENIDGVSQATKTAKGITDGVNTAMDYFNTHVKGEVG
jgi:electron transport complex protein RnfG